MKRAAGFLMLGVLVGGLLSVGSAQEAQPGASTVETAPVSTAKIETAPASTSKATRSEREPWNVDFVVNVLPASILINVDSDRFRLDAPDTGRTTLSSVYLMPNLSAGVGFEWWKLYVDLTAGAGVVVNDSFRTFLLQAALAASYAATDSLRVGPHLGLIYFTNPRWVGDGDVDFDESWGLLAGLQLSMGDRISYLVSVDLISASFDARSQEPGVRLDKDELSLTGLAVQFGVRGEF